jgi:hypothetical protein
MIDTPSQSLYTRAYVPLRTGKRSPGHVEKFLPGAAPAA